jgi:hypothetical protein
MQYIEETNSKIMCKVVEVVNVGLTSYFFVYAKRNCSVQTLYNIYCYCVLLTNKISNVTKT